MNKKLLGAILMIGLLAGCNMSPEQTNTLQELSKVFSDLGNR